MREQRLSDALSDGLAKGYFTGYQAGLLSGGRETIHTGGREGIAPASREVTESTLFDLASLTKPLLALALNERLAEGAISLDSRIDGVWAHLKGHRLGEVRIDAILGHRSGLPPFRRWEQDFAPREDETVRARILRGEGRTFARKALLTETPEVPREGSIYSDMGYFLLQLALEEGRGWDLRDVLAEGLPAVSNALAPRYVPLGPLGKHARFASTGRCEWRGRELIGEVHDPRAYLVGGVSAWAGLFGTAGGLLGVAGRVISLATSSGRAAAHLRAMMTGDVVTRRGGFVYGFMLPTPGISLGGAAIPASAVGHVGYTGTSWWIDAPTSRAIVLLTNLTAGGAGRSGFNTWRRRVHDLFWEVS